MEGIRICSGKRKILYFLESLGNSGNRAAQIVPKLLDFCCKSHSQHSVEDCAALLDKTAELAYSEYGLEKGYDFKRVHSVR